MSVTAEISQALAREFALPDAGTTTVIVVRLLTAAVLGGMLVGTALGIFFVPLFFALIRGYLEDRRNRAKPVAGSAPSSGVAQPLIDGGQA